MKKHDTQTAEMFKTVAPTMPEGYYSGDKPNPNLRAFVEAHLKERPYNPVTDDYDVPAFNDPIETTKVDPIYNLHPYDSKKSHLAIRQYIHHYCKSGDLVFDPFCGSGSALVAASAEGCLSIGIDFSPLATFISSEAVSPHGIADLKVAFQRLRHFVEDEINSLYASICHRCGGPATITGTVLSEQFQCLRCLNISPFSTCLPTNQENTRLCPICYERGTESEITTSFERKGCIIVAVAFKCHGKCRPTRQKRSLRDKSEESRKALAHDADKAARITLEEPLPASLQRRMLDSPLDCERWGLLWRPYLRGFATVADFFTARNLKVCLLLLKRIREIGDSSLLLVLSSILAKASHLMAQNSDGIGRVMKGTYYIGVIRREVNVWQFFCEAFEAVKEAKEDVNAAAKAPVMISCQDSSELRAIPNNSIDYVFTDPPYSGKVQFGELNFLREAFLELGTSQLSQEIVVNEERGLTENDWADRMRSAAHEIFRVLKPGRWATLCYHDTSEGTWEIVQDIMAEAGFVPDTNLNSLYIETRQKSIKQITAHKVTRRDLVINFRKPKPGEWQVTALYIPADADVVTFRELTQQIIREYLQAHPGAPKDRIYDELVSRMVRAGQMQSHNFDEILHEVAEEVKEPRKKNLFENADPDLFGSHTMSRWYLKESEESALDEAESALEDAAAQVMTAFIEKRLKEDPSREGVHYSDLFEHYIYAVKEKPRRQLTDWLLDYFYKTPEGTYRLPADEAEAKAKAEARASGVHRQIKRFLAYLTNGLAVPERERLNDATLADWLRHCKRTGLYEQGKLLYEQGGLNLDHLPEEVAVNVEEDYQVCVRSLARQAAGSGAHKSTRGRRKKTEARE